MYSIAIDGPAGAGKSTIAKMVAKKLQFIYVDTGAMFRSMALFFLREQVDLDKEDAIALACPKIAIEITYENGEQQVILNGENVSSLIRTEEVGNTASKIAVYGAVRKKLLDLQRNLANTMNVIMDGRDIGTTVLPNANAKIYLTASSHERARRRVEQLEQKGIKADFDEVERDIILRDEQDMNREISPLKQAEDATLVDSSNMSIEEVVDTIIQCFEAKKKA